MKPSAFNGAGNARNTASRGGNLTVGVVQNVNKRSTSQAVRGNSNVRTTSITNSRGKLSNNSKASTAASGNSKGTPIIKKTMPAPVPKARVANNFAVAKVSLNNLALDYNNK